MLNVAIVTNAEDSPGDTRCRSAEARLDATARDAGNDQMPGGVCETERLAYGCSDSCVRACSGGFLSRVAASGDAHAHVTMWNVARLRNRIHKDLGCKTNRTGYGIELMR